MEGSYIIQTKETGILFIVHLPVSLELFTPIYKVITETQLGDKIILIYNKTTKIISA